MQKIFLLFTYLLWGIVANAELTTPPKSVESSYSVLKNVLKNPGAELGKTDWTASAGTYTIETTAANVYAGSRSFSWDPAAGGDTFRSGAYALPAYQNAIAYCKIQTAATDMLFTVEDNSAVEQGTYTVPAGGNSEFINVFVPFSTGSGSATYRISIESASDSAVAKIDDCSLGVTQSPVFANVSQASLIGSAYFATTASCTFTRTNTALGALSDADCPGPTVESNPGPGTIQTTDADAPKVTVNNLPPGIYVVSFIGPNVIATSAQLAAVAINDGTDTKGQVAANNSTTTGTFKVTGVFSYGVSGNRTFELYASSAANAFNIDLTASNQRLYFYIERYPLESQLSYSQDHANFGWKSGGTITIGATTTPPTKGLVALDKISYKRIGDSALIRLEYSHTTAGASGTGDYLFSLPAGLQFDPAKVTYNTTVEGGPGGWLNRAGVSLGTFVSNIAARTASGSIVPWDATRFRMMGFSDFDAGAIGSGYTGFGSADLNYQAEFIAPILGWTDTNVPALLGSVITKEGLSVKRLLDANLNCDAGSAITLNPDALVASIGNVSGGACAVTLNSGLFSSTSNMFCSATPTGAFASVGLILSSTISSTTAVSVDCEDDASNACTAFDFDLSCRGAK